MKLSIVIPYHNADPWIGAMLDSLLDQDLSRDDYEIVVVDDGSTEEPVTLHRYADAYANIRVQRQENAGVAVARNTGLGLAKGEWIWFCDADDYVEPHVLGRLLSIAEERQLEMLWFDAVYVHTDRPVPAHACDWQAVSAVQTGWDYMIHPPAKIGMAVWRFLLCRDILDVSAIRFHDVTYMEGRWFLSELMPHVQRVAHVAACIYFYVQRDSSILHAKKRKNYTRYAADMYAYLAAVTEMMQDPSLSEAQLTFLRQRRDYEAYRLLGNVFRYCPVSLSETYGKKLAALGAWPVLLRGGRSEQLIRRMMNRRGLWMTACRMYHGIHRTTAKTVVLQLSALLVTCCSVRVAPGGEKAGTKTVQTQEEVAVNIDSLVKWESPNEVFYKDIFLDAGIGLTPRTFLYAADSLDLSLEGICFSRSDARPEEYERQAAVLAGTPEDLNGRLLYPDGQPRYRILFVCGGSSRTHAASLDSASRAHIRSFVQAGGSYVGTCAGAFLAASGYDSHPDYSDYLGLWPGTVQHTGLSGVYTGMYVEKASPLLAYADFGGDGYIEGVRHNKGGYPQSLPEGTEILARYDYPGKAAVHRQPSAWAYKADGRTGRLVLEGSHPEEVQKGERRAFTEAMILYAADGVGTVALKGILENGIPREMGGSSRLGDLQCHHFAVYVPAGAKNVNFSVESRANCDLCLRLCRDAYAFPSSAIQASGGKGARQRLGFASLETGVWYVSVQCLTTVTVVPTDYGQDYAGRIDVLNGVPYTITVSWEQNG